MEKQSPVDLDQPLRAGRAIEQDKLGRAQFAKGAAAAVQGGSPGSSFILSIEGAWGSGKTSTLAMVEELLCDEHARAASLAVHFNPWLIGDRDTLLRQFLAAIGSAIKLQDHAGDGKKVARELKSYAKAFDVLKFIPGAEPWASIVKSVVESVGDATSSIAEYKTPDIEKQKNRVAAALREYPRRVIVFIDDIDRLVPSEVFEMVRIVKAVGDLPQVTYVIAWDPRYVAGALAGLGVPYSTGYLDKIVQIRMPLPPLSISARNRLVDESILALGSEATKGYFPKERERFAQVYFAGLRDLLEQPRDVVRVFNVARVIKPALRGELVLADILGLAALVVKATPVMDLLRKHPRWFVGKLAKEGWLVDKTEELIAEGKSARDDAIHECETPSVVERLVAFLFPLTADTNKALARSRAINIEGHIGHPVRLLVALQLSIGAGDVSLVAARRYLCSASERDDVVRGLSEQNCLEFVERVGELARSLDGEGILDVDAMCIDLARLADTERFVARSQNRDGVFATPAADVVLRAIDAIVDVTGKESGPSIAAKVLSDPNAISVAADLVARDEVEYAVRAASDVKVALVRRFASNVRHAADEKRLLNLANPGFVLVTLARSAPQHCKSVFAAMRKADSTLDSFALTFLQYGFDLLWLFRATHSWRTARLGMG